MTRDEAIKELEQIDPREAEAWRACERIITNRDEDVKRHDDAIRHINSEADKLLTLYNADWFSLYTRKRQLQAILEISG